MGLIESWRCKGFAIDEWRRALGAGMDTQDLVATMARAACPELARPLLGLLVEGEVQTFL